MAQAYLGDFCARVDPNYQSAKHTRALCDALEAIERRDIHRLAVFMPPRHGKTIHISERFPAWYLGRNPDHQLILASYGAELAESNSRKVRNLLGSQRYPFSVRVASDSAAANRWATNRGGIVVAAGVGGSLTGFGANCLLADDLLRSREDADSEVYREKTWGWWTDVAQTRLMPGGTIVLGGTRWHEDDVYARVLNSPGGNEWHVINMPAIDEFGNALWPEWFDLDALGAIKEPMPPRSWAALYMQNPQAEEGGMFKRSTFGIRWKDPLPKMNFTVLTIDSAFKTGIMNDYSALALWGMSNQKYFLIHAVHGRWEFPDLIRKITALNSEYHPNVILIEDAASGQSAIQQLKLTRMPIVPYKERGSKESRAEAVTGIFESGRVVLPESAVWLDEWMDEHAGFPTSKHDDFVDTTSMALGYLSKKSGFGGRKLQPLDMRVRMGTRRR